jgi:dTDP-4-dehydrorhamnose reductase
VKLLITGANGRVGSALCAYFLQRGDEVIPVTRADVDLTNLPALRAFLLEKNFDCLINPAAMSAPDQCEQEPELAQRINADAPAVMAEIAQLRGVRMIHFSTDYVFAGDLAGKRRENDCAEPSTVYGRSKLAGEQKVLENAPGLASVLRVSWVYGGERPGFVDQVMAQLLAGQSVRAVSDKWSIPTALDDLCEWVACLSTSSPGGIWHGCHAGEPVSWYALAIAVQETLQAGGWLAQGANVDAQSITEMSQWSARRPIHTAMDSAKLSSHLPRPIVDWRDALRRVIEQKMGGVPAIILDASCMTPVVD